MSEFFQIEPDDRDRLKRDWDVLAGKYSSDQSLKDALWSVVETHYSEPAREYHNLSHIRVLLSKLEVFSEKINEPDAVRFAIWFHDVIYDTHKNDNEEKSAELATESLVRLGVPDHLHTVVKSMILATKSHSAHPASSDEALFLDLDLSILGAPAEIYKEYSNAIRREYSWVPAILYRSGRKRVLKSFLERDRLFQTDELYKKLEHQSRTNIQNELNALRTLRIFATFA